jgi:hypothetical protein
MKEGLLKSVIEGIISSIVAQALLLLASEILKFVLPFLGVTSPFDFLMIQFPFWTFLLIGSIVAFTFAFSYRSIERRKYGGKGFWLVKGRPLHILEEGVFTAFDVEWDVVYGYSSGRPYGFVERGPLCPKCKYEMDYKVKTPLFRRKIRVWHCLQCGRDYDIPKDVEDIGEAVKKLVEAHFRKKKYD